jgi:serine/threonine protein kinase
MSPEQVQGRKLDGRTDLFSLGSVLYTLVTGARPFAAESVPRIMNRVAFHQPPPATRLVPELPEAADYVLARSMAKEPSDRYPDGAALADDMEDILMGHPPRHRAGWTMPAPVEEVPIPVAPAPEVPLVDLDLQPLNEEKAPAGRRRRLSLFLVVFLAALSVYVLSRLLGALSPQ